MISSITIEDRLAAHRDRTFAIVDEYINRYVGLEIPKTTITLNVFELENAVPLNSEFTESMIQVFEANAGMPDNRESLEAALGISKEAALKWRYELARVRELILSGQLR